MGDKHDSRGFQRGSGKLKVRGREENGVRVKQQELQLVKGRRRKGSKDRSCSVWPGEGGELAETLPQKALSVKGRL